jgi:hypothetical protein
MKRRKKWYIIRRKNLKRNPKSRLKNDCQDFSDTLCSFVLAPMQPRTPLFDLKSNLVLNLAGLFGQLIALFICDRIGRRKAALFGCLLTFPGVLLSLAAKWLQPAFEVLFAGRFIWSMANGLLSVVQTIWLVESAPAVRRGAVSAVQEVLGGLGKH